MAGWTLFRLDRCTFMIFIFSAFHLLFLLISGFNASLGGGCGGKLVQPISAKGAYKTKGLPLYRPSRLAHRVGIRVMESGFWGGRIYVGCFSGRMMTGLSGRVTFWF